MLLVALLTAAGCGADGTVSPGKRKATMDATEARTRIDALLDGTFAAVKPPLEWLDGWYTVAENTSGIDDRPDGTAHITGSRHVTTKVAQAKYGALLGVVERYWRKQGYRIVSINADDRMPSVDAETPDGNRVSIEIGYPGNVTVTAGVPSIEDPGDYYPFGSGPPMPTTADGDPDIMPKVDDPFWSH
jgi:hypothetical protein